MTFPIGIADESRVDPFIALGRDQQRDAPPSQGGADGAAAVDLIGGQPVGLEAWPPTAQPLDPAGSHQRGERLAIVNFPAGQSEGYRLAEALGANVDLSREAAARAAQLLVVVAPPFRRRVSGRQPRANESER